MSLAAMRRLLGWLLLWALLPLPFLYIVLPPFWLAAGAAAAALVLVPDRVWSPTKLLLNALAVVIVVLVLAAGGLNVGPLRPLGHLLLLLTALRVLMVRDRPSFLRGLALVGMVWVVSVAASTHMTASVYFVASAVIGWWVGIRVHLTGLGLPATGAGGPLPRPRHVLLAAGAAVVIAVPVFLVMPRLGQPWVAGSSFARTTGFAPAVDLGAVGRLTESQEVALVIRSAGGAAVEEAWTRLRGTAFDQVMAGSWLPRQSDVQRLETSRGLAWLTSEVRSLDDAVELEIDLLRPRRYLMLPPGAIAVQAATEMAVDPYGGVLVGYRRGQPLSYRVWVGEPRPPEVAPPGPRDLRLPRSHEGVRQLALSVAGGARSNEAKAAAVERYLKANYRYSLESGVRIQTVDPVAWFLLEGGAGHCEFFAGAMVVLLRHLGVPARMVAGYNGGDVSPDGDQVVVREANAHAWVEVWLGAERGWEVFDPTPAVGVRGLSGVSGLERARWAWQQLELYWDRRLLTFGLGEQIELVEGLGAALQRGLETVRRREMAVTAAALAAGVLVLAAGAGLWRRRRPAGATTGPGRGPAGRAVRRLARTLVPVGGVVPPSATVRDIGRQAAAFWPRTAAPVAELVSRAEDELYGPDGGRADTAAVRRLWKAIRRGMRGRERFGGA
ncbi:MAG TPA: transglutaminaseTgpA domain-containing protein [Methylomirabilota bacterium]|nr:transglutaminaseTgpA domain-containing protein [Methylomirabilota bacterium]